MRFVYSDMLGYVERAARLASGAPLAPIDAFFPPGTHLLLSIPIALCGLVTGLWVATLLWCLLSIATVYVSWRLARILLTPAAAALTAAFCAVWPLFITYGGYFTSETPALAFLVTALWAGVEATRRDGRAALVLALAGGILGGAAAATRPQLLINALILLTVALFSRKASAASAAGLASGLLLVLALVVALNSAASGHLVGLARNGGVNFWLGHCDVKTVNTVNADNVLTYSITHPVASQLGRTGVIVVKNHDVWDEGLFVGLGLRCIEEDGVGHIARLGQNILDMTATTTPWPQSAADGWPRTVVQAANLAYAVLLPFILVGSLLLLVRRRREGWNSGEAFFLVNLVCVVVVAVLAIGDPRVRTVYDVFGFALLGALLADRLHLDRLPDEEALEDR
ncbi:glycosyltransferase family 39 protein [Actinomycetospora sp. NBRC 106378]|uniref:glycosyltransferase family 39 protein n=1 Tax=Actinomycetospora sp. NBRC 106378 TaxID=3032208 RepID=UPI00255344B1|nr:glycosyltransferase family 39 protein [Actinomycetospora sp. NBRC 106378]